MSSYDNASSMCGKCMHHKDAHVPDNGHLMYCSKCMKYCDVEEYNTPLKPSGTVVQDGVSLKCH
jgi:hypothetical protein